METKHTKEYAEKLAAEKFHDTTTAGYLDHWSRSSQRDFIIGYMEAIKQTAAPDLLEALIATNMLNLHLYEEGTVGNRVYKEIQNAIKKATE